MSEQIEKAIYRRLSSLCSGGDVNTDVAKKPLKPE